MTKKTKIIIGVAVAVAVIGGVTYYISKKLKDKRESKGLGTDEGKSLLDTSGASSGEYNPRNDSMFGKGLGVLLRPSTTPSAPKTTTTIPRNPNTTTTTTSSTPNFTKGIF